MSVRGGPSMEATQRAVCELVRVGVEPVQAARTQLVSEPVFEEWMRLGRVGGTGHARHVEFRDAILQAEAECEAALVMQIRAGKNWQAATWLAERRFPERFLRRSVGGERSDRDDGRPAGGGAPFEDLDNVVPLNSREKR
jgi:hypothetical protein